MECSISASSVTDQKNRPAEYKMINKREFSNFLLLLLFVSLVGTTPKFKVGTVLTRS